MSSDSGSTSLPTTAAFASSDINKFKKQGDLMGEGNADDLTTPQATRFYQPGSVRDPGMSSMSTDQVSALASIFSQRAAEINERTARPGRKVTMFNR